MRFPLRRRGKYINRLFLQAEFIHLTNLPKYAILKLSDISSMVYFINWRKKIMLQRINKAISRYGTWIFIIAALYKFTFWIIIMVNSFRLGAGSGLHSMFSGLFSMVLDLVILAVILEVSRKIAEKYTAADFATPAFNTNLNGYNPAPANNFNAAPQAPVQNVAPVQPQAPVQNATPVQPVNNAAPSGVWYCSNCGTQNNGATSFCSKCGKPK